MLSEQKRNILRNRQYVYLDGAWRHKGKGPSLSPYAVEILSEAHFEEALDRYTSALERCIHQVRIGLPLFPNTR